MRKFALLVSLVVMVVATASPASARRPVEGIGLEEGHKITICHATRSLSNPYVKITIDLAAWDGDIRAHGPGHHAREKNGVQWADVALVNPTDDCPTVPPPPTGEYCEWTQTWVDHVIEFGTKLYYPIPVTATAVVDIPKGTYDVVLISSDPDRGGTLYQPHEQWRLLGSTPSGYSDDFADDGVPVVDDVKIGLSVRFNDHMDLATAEHWSVNPKNGGTNPNSVVPQAACLTLKGRG